MLELRNPHSILAVLERRPKAVKSLRVQSEASGRSEERRVGKESRSRWSTYH